MSTVAIGSPASITLGDSGSVSIASNGGLFTVAVAPSVGAAQTFNYGPLSTHCTIGGYAIGATVVITNVSCNTLTYVQSGGGGAGGTSTIAGATDYSTATLPAQATQIALKLDANKLGAANGAAPLDASSKLPLTNLPAISMSTLSDGSATLAALAGKIGPPTLWDATQTAPIASGVAPTVGAPSSYSISNAGVTVLGTPIDGIASVRYGDLIQWNPTSTTWVRYAGETLQLAVSSSLTLVDAHDGCTLNLTGTPTLTLNTGRKNNFGVILIGAHSWAGTAVPTDGRQSNGNASAPSCLINTGTDTYTEFGGKL